jgi:cytochrome c oxidase assembly factor CtaG
MNGWEFALGALNVAQVLLLGYMADRSRQRRNGDRRRNG